MNNLVEVNSNAVNINISTTILRYVVLFDSAVLFIIFLITLVKSSFNHYNSINMKNVLRTTRSTDRKINTILFKLRMATKADRVVLGLFHNTNLYGYNYHLLKMSVFHESLNDTAISIKQKVKDIPLSYLGEEFSEYEKNDNKFIATISNNLLASGCRAHLESIKVKTIVNYLMHSDNIPFGILSLQFTEENSALTLGDVENSIRNMYGQPITYFHNDIIKSIMKNG